jgi:adenosylmethionine-8-amino-7-oxononanoate aminotransferase
MEKVMHEKSSEVCALIIEPMVQAVGGMIVFPPGYLRRIRELCSQYNILMIADEVATGWGRTGKMFACQHEEVRPDIMTLGKGITGGYLPLAATLTSQEIFDSFLGEYEEQKTFYHGHTYTGNPLSCSCALASIELFEKDRVLDTLKEKIELLKKKLKAFSGLYHVGEVRQLGFMVGIELVRRRENKEAYPVGDRVGHKVILEARKKGAILRPLGDTIVIMPPLSISPNELEGLADITYESIRKVTEGN